MTLIPLSHRNFVNNKIVNTTKIKYKNSDLSTYIYDINIDSKSILNTQDYEDITQSEIGVNSIGKVQAARVFFQNEIHNHDHIDNIQDSNKIKFETGESISSFEIYPKKYFEVKPSPTQVTNDNLKAYNFRNSYGIERVEQTFLPQSFELQKKNYVKNSLYKAYQKDFSLDFYNNLEFGFCNWNSINFFSQRYNSDTNHTNCIVWPNSKKLFNNQYNFVNNSSFNTSFYFNLRKSYNSVSSPKPECVLHIPDILSLYIIPSYNSDPVSHRIAFTLGVKSKLNLIEIAGISSNLTRPPSLNWPYSFCCC